MKKTIFTQFAPALEYAESVGINTNTARHNLEYRSQGEVIANLGQKVGFDIDGFCEVVPLVYVYEYENDAEIKYRGELLHLLGTDEYYFISNRDKGKYGLTSAKFIDTAYNTFRYFKTELVAPQNIGKATKSKVLCWVEYARTLEREKLAYWQARKDRREKAMASIREKYPDAYFRKVGGVWNEYDFEGWEVRIEPEGTCIRIDYEFDACGSIGTTYNVNYTESMKISKSIIGE